MRLSTLTAAAATLGAAATFLIPASAASAATTTYPHFVGGAAGSYVVGLGGAVYSGSTAASGVDTISTGRTSSNSLATVSALGGLLKTGALTTSVATSAVPGGVAITAHARTAGVNLLNGLITADVVDTTSTATVKSGGVSSDIGTTFVSLAVNHARLPVTVSKNTTITVPGVATVILNYTASTPGTKAMATSGAGAYIRLLSRVGSLPAGADIWLNPVNASISQVGPGYAPLYGYAYGTSLSANVGTALNVQSGPTGATYMPPAGTGGKDDYNPTAAVNLPGVASVGAVQSVSNGLASGTGSHATLTSNLAHVNLLGGAVVADAITATASASKSATGATRASGGASFVNLKVLGAVVAANAPANTVIKLGNVGTVTLNTRIVTSSSSLVVGLAIHLTSAAYGLPANADVYVAVAAAAVLS